MQIFFTILGLVFFLLQLAAKERQQLLDFANEYQMEYKTNVNKLLRSWAYFDGIKFVRLSNALN